MFVAAIEEVAEDVGCGGLVVAATQLAEPDVVNEDDVVGVCYLAERQHAGLTEVAPKIGPWLRVSIARAPGTAASCPAG